MTEAWTDTPEGDDDDITRFIRDILRELNEPPVVAAPRDRTADRLPFTPSQVSLRTLLLYAKEYRHHEPLFSRVMVELLSRDCSAHKQEVRDLEEHWRYLVRSSQPTRWPESAIQKEGQAFDGRCFQCGEQGMLAFFGYHVGATRGLLMPVRQHILDYIYKGRLPFVNSAEYTRSWGEPSSARRLERLASMIAYLMRNAIAKQNASYADAVSEWAADLHYLKRMYYRPATNPAHDWDWPSVQTY